MKPPVALESTVITHGLPYPENLEIAREMEEAVRHGGGDPKILAYVDGRLRVGVDEATLEKLASLEQVRKCSLRDVPLMNLTKEWGGTTVSSTLYFSLKSNIPVFATGGIGGVHKGDELDVSADLPALASFPGTVVCAGVKSILDIPRTLERLETDGITVLGYGTDEFPAFYSRESGLPVDLRVETPGEVAEVMMERDASGLTSSILVVVPCPSMFAIPADELDPVIAEAQSEADSLGVAGKELTPFLLKRVAEKTKGKSLAANRALLIRNAEVAAHIAVAFSAMSS